MARKNQNPTKRRKKSSDEVVTQNPSSNSSVTSVKENKYLDSMRNIFDSVQKGFTNVSKNIEKLWQLKNKQNDEEAFFANFWYCLQHACLVAAREPPTERIIQFCCKFAIRADSTQEMLAEPEVLETGPFALKLFDTVLKYTNANNKAVRFRLCQIINMMLTFLGTEASIDEVLFNRIYSEMLERLQDKVPNVRVQAVQTLNRLQDPVDPECPVIKGYLNIMKNDGVGDVRRAAVKAIALTSKTIIPVIERARDVNPGVRRAVYEVLIDKVSIRTMRISYRMDLLQNGLIDRNEKVKETCKKLIQKWLLYHDNDIIKLLVSLDVEGKRDVCYDVVNQILSTVFIDTASECLLKRLENKVIPTSELSPESVFYWRCLIEYCQTNHPDMYEKIMPTLTEFSAYLKEYVDNTSNIDPDNYDAHYQASYIIVELIKMAKLGDMSDEAGRKNLIEATKYIISEAEITVQAVDRLVELYCAAEPDEKRRIREIADIINDIRNPLDGATQHDLNAIESCEKNDAVTMIRCLTLLSGLIREVKCDVAFDPTLSGLLDDIIMSGVISENEIVRHLAIKALGFSCVLSKTLAKKYLVFFLQAVQVDNFTEILETTLRIVFDLLLVFGFETFSEDKSAVEEPNSSDGTANEENSSQEDILSSRMENTSLGNEEVIDDINAKTESFEDQVIEKFKQFLDDEVLRNVAAEGIAKLMYNNRLVDATLFSRLLLLCYNPTTEGDSLRHCLGMFFSTYGANDNKEALGVIEKAFFPTIQTLCNAPHTSPLLEVNPQNVAELMLTLLRGYHDEQMIIEMCNEILINPKSKYGRCLTKVLNNFNINPSKADEANLKLIYSLVTEIQEHVEHPSSKKALRTFLLNIEDFVKQPSPEQENIENAPNDNVVNGDDPSSQNSILSETPSAKMKTLYRVPEQPLDFLDTIT